MSKDEQLGIIIKWVMGRINNSGVSPQWFRLDAENGYAQGDKGQIQNKRKFLPREQPNLKIEDLDLVTSGIRQRGG